MGLRSHLPSKGINLWSSSRRKAKNGSDSADPGDVRYFGAQGGDVPASSSNDRELEAMFDSLRDESRDPKSEMAADSAMQYLSEGLKVNMEDAALFVPLELFQAPTLGEITRAGFIAGWKQARVSPTRSAQASYIKKQVAKLSTNPDYFKKVYKYAFVVGKEPTQKALGLEEALTFWTMLFAAPGMTWASESVNWLGLWTDFLRAKWTRSVNRDMWNQVLEFAGKTRQDETLGFWSEDGAWHSVIDSFVKWCKDEKKIGTGNSGGAADMEMTD